MPIGTATFFAIGERLFLISAAHNFEDTELSGFAVSENKAKGNHIPLSGQLCWPTAEHRDRIDVAALALSEECAERVRDGGWQALTLDNVQAASPSGTFVLCGYPSENVRQRGETLLCGLITAFTERLPEPPQNLKFPADPDVDLFFYYDPIATDTEGREVSTPHLLGASGSNVWEYTEPRNDELWTPAKAIKAVGVQSSTLKGEWFRAKTWGAVLSAIRTAHPDLAPEIDSVFSDPSN